MKVFNQVQLMPVERADDVDGYLRAIEESVVINAYRSGYYLPEKISVTKTREVSMDGVLRVTFRGYGVKIADPDE